jgi:hypothetical protein
MNMPRRHTLNMPHRRAFTLIELLVVLGCDFCVRMQRRHRGAGQRMEHPSAGRWLALESTRPRTG